MISRNLFIYLLFYPHLQLFFGSSDFNKFDMEIPDTMDLQTGYFLLWKNPPGTASYFLFGMSETLGRYTRFSIRSKKR